MRVKRVKPTKLAIQKKQNQIANSINVSEITKQNLVAKNNELLEDIGIKEVMKEEIENNTKELISNEKKAKQDYKKAKVKLDDINALVKDAWAKNKDKLDEIESLNKSHEKQIEDRTKAKDKEERKLKKEISNIKTTIDWLKSDKSILSKENKSLSKSNESLSEKISDKESIVIGKAKEVNRLDKMNSDIKQELVSNIKKRDNIKNAITSIEKDHKASSKEMDKVKLELAKEKLELAEARNELLKAKELTLTLVKKEEKLNELAANIIGHYKKAWIDLKI